MNSKMIVLAVLCGVLLLTGSTNANQDDAEQAKVEAECDLLAASPYDLEYQGKGVYFRDINAAAAIDACGQAVRLNPSPRIQYQFGRSLDKAEQFKEAAEWIRKAAEQGHARALFDLGVMYAEGRGVTKNKEEAEKWYRIARERRKYLWKIAQQTSAPTPSLGRPPNLLATLTKGDISSIPQDAHTYYAVGMIISALGYSQCSLLEPQLSLWKPHYANLLTRLEEKTKKVAAGPGVLAAALNPDFLKTIAFLDSKGCDSMEVQAVMENAFRFLLGRDPTERSAPVPLNRSRQNAIHVSDADRFCSELYIRLNRRGKEDPACENLINFMKRGTRPDGGELPQVLRCKYGVLTVAVNRGIWKDFVFWYERVPDELGSLAAEGRDPFPGVEAVVCTECPKDTNEVAILLQNSR